MGLKLSLMKRQIGMNSGQEKTAYTIQALELTHYQKWILMQPFHQVQECLTILLQLTVTYTDADNHDGTISATVCETNLLENCQASFNLDKGVGENSDGVVYSKTFTTAFGGDDITVSLNATDDHDFALLNRTATFEIDTDRPWLVSDSVVVTAGAGENVTISVVYCIFDDADDDAVSVNVGGTPYDLVGGDPSEIVLMVKSSISLQL